jgi:hypothetical protein
VLFSGNVLTEVTSEHTRLRDPVVGAILEAAPAP